MDFDFYITYKDYANIDLLKIVKCPSGYQPKAIEAAKQILSNREVTSEEMETVDLYFKSIEEAQKVKKQKIETLKENAVTFFQPITRPTEKVQPDKWINLLLVALILEYAWTLFYIAMDLIDFFQCEQCTFDVTLLFDFLTLIYVPVIFFLIFKRRRWGWILLFADNLFSFILRVSEIVLVFQFKSLLNADPVYFFLPILIKGSFAYFLWRPYITGYFGISKEVKRKTLTLTIAGTVIFILILKLMFLL